MSFDSAKDARPTFVVRTWYYHRVSRVLVDALMPRPGFPLPSVMLTCSSPKSSSPIVLLLTPKAKAEECLGGASGGRMLV